MPWWKFDKNQKGFVNFSKIIPKEERGRTGSEKNEPGDTKTSRGGIEVSQEVETTLKDKIKKEETPAETKSDLEYLKELLATSNDLLDLIQSMK